MKIIWYITAIAWLLLMSLHVADHLLFYNCTLKVKKPIITKVEPPLLFNKPILHFQRAGKWVEFKILESF